MAVRAVLDTNLIVSYLLSEGETMSRLIDLWEEKLFVYVISQAMLDELEEVVDRPHLRTFMKGEPGKLVRSIKSDAEMVPGELELTGVCRDPKDDKFIACAIEGKADFIVTGDKDLLDLGAYQSVKMIQASEFVRLLDGESR